VEKSDGARSADWSRIPDAVCFLTLARGIVIVTGRMKQEGVVLLYGIMRTSRSMARLERHLVQEGFEA
jgi:hypothetical protein